MHTVHPNNIWRLSRMLAKHTIKSVALPPRQIISYLPPVKDALGLRTPGIYSIPCECGRVYIGQSGRSIQIRTKEHSRVIRLAQPDKSAVVEHSIYRAHIINPLGSNVELRSTVCSLAQGTTLSSARHVILLCFLSFSRSSCHLLCAVWTPWRLSWSFP